MIELRELREASPRARKFSEMPYMIFSKSLDESMSINEGIPV
jgi:hypothetical protein